MVKAKQLQEMLAMSGKTAAIVTLVAMISGRQNLLLRIRLSS